MTIHAEAVPSPRHTECDVSGEYYPDTSVCAPQMASLSPLYASLGLISPHVRESVCSHRIDKKPLRFPLFLPYSNRRFF